MCWLSLKINDDKILARVKDLPQVIVAVATDPHGRDLTIRNRSKACKHLPLAVKDLLGVLVYVLWEVLEVPTEKIKNVRGKAPHGLIEGALVEF